MSAVRLYGECQLLGVVAQICGGRSGLLGSLPWFAGVIAWICWGCSGLLGLLPYFAGVVAQNPPDLLGSFGFAGDVALILLYVAGVVAQIC